ncbi:MAG: 16S rRNA (guanine(966)-N(2))-methyltransferase RsmD [Armatimonadetes bacterium CG2_30_59_28]|nr:MAG: 16S rRNA (guanine(966)-N(2))-methyltransferase RsmD [Armatimonadetes bacterium CG2_30_59_28]
MRVIAGSARSIPLATRKGTATRPTLGRVRETLFSTLQPQIRDAVFLDLFAGSGSVGIEALSRGAKCAIFVESNTFCVELIRENLERTGLKESGEIIRASCLSALGKLRARGKQFDIIFSDPPYGKRLNEAVLHWLRENGDVMNPDGLVITQGPVGEPTAAAGEPLVLRRQRTVGSTVLSFHALPANDYARLS